MNTIDSKKLWAFIDGQCEKEEAEAIKTGLGSDPELKAEWASRMKLHQSLQKMEAEQPSLRFVRNIMDKLPKLYQKLSIQPIVKPIWVRLTAVGFLVFLVGYVAIVNYYVAATGLEVHFTFVDRLQQLLEELPFRIFVIFTATITGLALITVLDQFLKKRFQPK